MTTTLCGAVASWLSKMSVNALSACTVTAGVSKAVALVAVIVTVMALGSIDDDGAGPLDPVQQSGTGVALGSGLNVGSRQPLNVRILPSAPTIGSLNSGVRRVYSCVLGARMNAIRSAIWM